MINVQEDSCEREGCGIVGIALTSDASCDLFHSFASLISVTFFFRQ